MGDLFNTFFNPSVGGVSLGISDREQQLASVVHSIAVQEIQKSQEASDEKDGFKRHQNDKDLDDATFDEKVEASKKYLKKIMDLFRKTNKARNEFLENFPHWRILREKNIDLLYEIAVTTHKDKFRCNIGKLAGGVIGVAGGAALVGALLFPPAIPALLPAWLGGATVSAFIPTFLLPAAVPALAPLAVGGGVAAGAGGITAAGASMTQMVLLKKRMEEAKEVLQADQLGFTYMENWFKHTKELIEAVEAVIGFEVINVFLKDLSIFFTPFKNIHDLGEDMYPLIKSVLKICIRRLLSDGSLELQFGMYLAAIIITFLVVFVFRNRFLFNCVMKTQRLLDRFHISLDTVAEMTRVLAATGMTGAAAAEVLPAAARNLSLGVFAGVGIALNIATVVLTSIDIKKGSSSKQGEEVTNAATKLMEEFLFLEEIYNNLKETSDEKRMLKC